MRVRCERLINPGTLQPESSSPWLEVGGEYAVLTVMALPEGTTWVRIYVDDERGAMLLDSRMFVTVDTSIPANWVSAIDDRGALRLGPATWLEPGYWESYYDGDPSAVTTFHRELEVIAATGRGDA